MNTNENARVTIDYNAYDYLKDIEFQMRFLIDKVRKESVFDGNKVIPNKVGKISKQDFDKFIYNLLDIEELVIVKEEVNKNV